MRHFADTFTPFPIAQALVAQLVESCGEFSHLTSARLPCLLSQRALVERGKAMPGTVITPVSEMTSSAKRTLMDWLLAMYCAPLCDREEPDFILLFDVALWPGREDELLDREHLVYHVLSHIEQSTDQFGSPKFGDDGRAKLRLRAHDIERFLTEVDRYGQGIAGIKDEKGIYAASRMRDETRRGQLQAVRGRR